MINNETILINRILYDLTILIKMIRLNFSPYAILISPDSVLISMYQYKHSP